MESLDTLASPPSNQDLTCCPQSLQSLLYSMAFIRYDMDSILGGMWSLSVCFSLALSPPLECFSSHGTVFFFFFSGLLPCFSCSQILNELKLKKAQNSPMIILQGNHTCDRQCYFDLPKLISREAQKFYFVLIQLIYASDWLCYCSPRRINRAGLKFLGSTLTCKG